MTTYQYTLSLHDALPICFDLKKLMEDKFNELKDLRGQLEGKIKDKARDTLREKVEGTAGEGLLAAIERDRKSTRLNSSHRCSSYAVFCLKKKRKNYLSTT